MNFGLICIPGENRSLLRSLFGQKAGTISDPKAALFAPFRPIALVSPLSSSDLKLSFPFSKYFESPLQYCTVISSAA